MKNSGQSGQRQGELSRGTAKCVKRRWLEGEVGRTRGETELSRERLFAWRTSTLQLNTPFPSGAAAPVASGRARLWLEISVASAPRVPERIECRWGRTRPAGP